MALQFVHFIAYTTPSDWQLRFSLRGTSVFGVDMKWITTTLITSTPGGVLGFPQLLTDLRFVTGADRREHGR